MSGENVNPGPTITSTIWLVAEGTPLIAGRPFLSTMRKGALLVFAIFARFSLHSARTRIPIAKMAASQKINRAALDIFILLVFFSMRQHWEFRCVQTRLTLSAQYWDLRRWLQTTQAES